MNESLRILAVLAMLTAVGCGKKEAQIVDNSARQTAGERETATRDLLARARFRQVPADTAEKEALLKSLPPGQLSMITWKDQTLYVHPDVANNQALVGRRDDYELYERLRTENKLSNENLIAAQMNRDSMRRWGVWAPNLSGGFDGRTRR
jgi:hypothetical protein